MHSEADVEANQAILHVVEFVDDLGCQVNALRNAVIRLLRDTNWRDFGLKLAETGAEDVTSASEWIRRSMISTFVLRAFQPGRSQKKGIYGAFQVSLAPSDKARSSDFFPYVAVMLAVEPGDRGISHFQCEEFQLDDAYLEDSGEWEGEPWVKMDQPLHWGSANGLDVAFVVPLMSLRTDEDARRLVVQPLVHNVKLLASKLPRAKS